MKEQEIITKVAEQTGVSSEQCTIIMKSFEESSQEALINKFKGVKNNKEEVITMIAQDTKIDFETCNKVVNALEETLGSSLADKLTFKK